MKLYGMGSGSQHSTGEREDDQASIVAEERWKK